MMSWDFTWNAAPGRTVGDGEIRADAGAPFVGTVQRLTIANLSRHGSPVRTALQTYGPGTLIYIEAPADSTRFLTVTVTGPVEALSGAIAFPVACTAASPAGLPTGPVEAFFLAAGRLRDAATDPALITLDTAKAHLRITDTDHDPDITQKLTAASAAIRDYLKDRNDPAWTPATAPPWIIAAVLLLLAHLYEHRGDEFGASQDNDPRVWAAIDSLVRRSRDPALA